MAGMMSGCGEDSGSTSDDTEHTEDVGMANDSESGEAVGETEIQPEEAEPAVYYLVKETGYTACEYVVDVDLCVEYEREYDENGNLVRESQFDHQYDFETGEIVHLERIKTEYDAAGNLLFEEFIDGVGAMASTSRTEYEYDAAGNLLSEKKSTIYMYGDEEYVDTSTKEYEYDAAGNLISITNSNSAYPQTFEYDAAGNLIRFVDGTPNYWTEYQYDETGNLIKEIKHADGNEDLEKFDYIDQVNEYDTSGNLIKEIINNNGFSGSHYGRYLLEQKFDAAGNLIKWDEYRDGSEQVTSSREYEYDEEGRIIKETYINYVDYDGNFYDEPLSNTSTYSYEEEYDELGNLIRFIMYNDDRDYVDHWTEYEYDETGNLIRETVYYGDGNSNVKSRIEYEYAVQ